MTEDAFIRAQTVIGTAALVPEIRLHLATEITPIWQATEAWLERAGQDLGRLSQALTDASQGDRRLEPPFWAFAWPGAQALARHVLDRPERVQGRTVLDFGAGGGLAAIACAQAGARPEAAEIDPIAGAAIALNAALNGVEVRVTTRDVVGCPCRWDLILCGDVCYEAPMTRHILPWLRQMAAAAEVWVADPGRAYLPPDGIELLDSYDVPTSMELEDRLQRTTRLYRLLAAA